ncbi:zinc-ribbon domain-containing protein [Gottfriedia solisilvae]|uniref:Zinc-ribbon domain-containing protein n=1 Tax=Gottfriedia solisilvae TaxID=1516104 RepID=A0A8J3F0T2_9BACI|nr:zinc-ribbon domain-containing protein [Gottfriedia solisilvae]GGI12591.1 hypothetical protein GCM10007380_13680 [Gottfriedia solisilvae]
MSILEEKIWVTLSSNTFEHYENLGYRIPRTFDGSKNKMVIRKGTKILVLINDLPKFSQKKLTKVCDECGKKTKNLPYFKIHLSRERGDGKDRCFKCATKRRVFVQKNNVDVLYEKSLEYWAKINGKEFLMIEFSNKNKKKPCEINYGSKTLYLWECQKCKSEYKMTPERRRSRNCPYCNSRKVNHTNCLWTTSPHIAKHLKDPQKGYELTSGSSKKECFICPNCAHEQLKTIYSMANKGFTCSICGDGIPYGEKFIFKLLKALNVDFETQKIFNWSKNIIYHNSSLSGTKRYDNYIQNMKMIIEIHGLQHFYPSFERFGGRRLVEELENDILKEKLAKENGIEIYIVIDCRHSELNWIKNSILNSSLNSYFDLSNINWNECHEFACNSLVISACELWNEGIKDKEEIGKIFGLSKNTIHNYLKNGDSLSLCNYVPYFHISKQIIQLSLNGEIITEYASISEAARAQNISKRSMISECCYGKRETAVGYKWMFKEDYERILQEVSFKK